MDSSDDNSYEGDMDHKNISDKKISARSDKSLCVLTEKFIELVEQSGESLIDIAEAAKVMIKLDFTST